MSETTDNPLCLSLEQAAEFVGVPADTIQNQYRCRALPGVKVGKHLRFRRCDLIRFVEELEPANGT
jgi:excisionase family DNA binding protein